MSAERPVESRSKFLAVALVAAVVACGGGGLLFARHALHAGSPVRAASGGDVPSDPRPGLDPGRDPDRAPADTVTRTAPGTSRELPAPLHPVPAPDLPPAGTPDSETPGEITDDQEVELALHRWQKALLTNDATEIAPSYAAHVNRYFLQTQVSRAYVQDYMEKEEERGVRLTAYELQNVSIKHIKQDEVEVDFHADFRVSTPSKDRTGTARTVLMLRREDGDWKIVYERDFRS